MGAAADSGSIAGSTGGTTGSATALVGDSWRLATGFGSGGNAKISAAGLVNTVGGRLILASSGGEIIAGVAGGGSRMGAFDSVDLRL